MLLASLYKVRKYPVLKSVFKEIGACLLCVDRCVTFPLPAEWVFPRVFRCWWRLKNRFPYLVPPIPQCYLRLMTRWSRGRVNDPRDVPAVGNNVHHNDEQVEMEEMR